MRVVPISAVLALLNQELELAKDENRIQVVETLEFIVKALTTVYGDR